jgi:deazaflavin-dependent oxidoreductase (nitroreductase family)
MSDWNTQVIEEFRANGGKVESMGGAPLLILHTVGAKSGEVRESPVLYREEGDDLVIFASYAGAPTNPAWYHNLLANPEVTVELGDGTKRMRARVAEGEERDRIWVDHKANWPQFQEYEDKTDRTIPVVVLEPVG